MDVRRRPPRRSAGLTRRHEAKDVQSLRCTVMRRRWRSRSSGPQGALAMLIIEVAKTGNAAANIRPPYILV
jgi:hypothetical protein